MIDLSLIAGEIVTWEACILVAGFFVYMSVIFVPIKLADMKAKKAGGSGTLMDSAEGGGPEGDPLPDDVSNNDDFCIKNEEFCIRNEESCILNDEFCRMRTRRRRAGRSLRPSRRGSRCLADRLSGCAI